MKNPKIFLCSSTIRLLRLVRIERFKSSARKFEEFETCRELTGTKCLQNQRLRQGVEKSITNGATKGVASLSKTRLDMIEAGGRLCQLLGVPRSTGQIYGLLYLSPKALSLDEIAELLGISKASASNGTRQLLGWRAIRQVWVHGERRDHYEVEPDLANILRVGYADFIKPRLASSRERLDKMSFGLEEELTQGSISQEDYKLCSERLKSFQRVQNRLQALIPLAEKLI